LRHVLHIRHGLSPCVTRVSFWPATSGFECMPSEIKPPIVRAGIP
jgi:hypothetical protein